MGTATKNLAIYTKSQHTEDKRSIDKKNQKEIIAAAVHKMHTFRMYLFNTNSFWWKLDNKKKFNLTTVITTHEPGSGNNILSCHTYATYPQS